MKRLCFVFGTRPEAIKLAPVVLLARERASRFEAKICVTGQHREMLDQMLAVFGIEPDVDFGLMQHDQSLAAVGAETLRSVSRYLDAERTDWVIVQGDTTTTAAAALAAAYCQVAVAHVEAGLRTGDRRQPFPEEINRTLVSHVADLHLSPTSLARDNLLKEHIAADRIVVTGNTVVDALRWILKRLQDEPPQALLELQRWHRERIGDREMVLITGHRRESFGAAIEEICAAIVELAERHPKTCWVYPVHLNPNVQEPVRRILGARKNVELIDPLPYDAFVWLMSKSRMILTDSGGIQEEAPSLGIPVVVTREKTERPEGLQAGVIRLAGRRRERIVAECESVLAAPSRVEGVENPYGDGRAAERVLDALEAFEA
jgi:UDP-N-acetylglucosamine 2-epimerase (non-hydrolysing)